MGVYINKNPENNLKILIKEDNGIVSLRYNGHDFVKCYTDEDGQHYVVIIDADTGVVSKHSIRATCWSR